MSSQNPTPRRRRIAGERKAPRVSVPDMTTDTDTTTAAGVGTATAPEDAPTAPPSSHRRRTRDVAGPARGPEDVQGVERAEERPEKRPVPWPVMAGLAVLALVLVVLAAGPFVDGMGLGAYQDVRQQSRVDEARRTAPAVAERAAQAILSYDYKSLESDRDAAAAFMTPAYRKKYLDTFDGLVLDHARDLKAHVEADVRASGVSLADEDRVQVLLFVNQVTTSTANGGQPQNALNRVMFDMKREGDTWRVDNITSY